MRIILDKSLKKGEKLYIEIELPEGGLLTTYLRGGKMVSTH